MDLIKPIVPSLKKEYFLMMKDAFLTQNNLSVGDKIMWEFDYQYTRSGYKRGEVNRFTGKKLCEGILKIDENGFLYAESIDDLEFYKTAYKGRKLDKSYYQRFLKKSVHFFGVGFLFLHKSATQ